MDLTKLMAIAKFKVGDTVLKLGEPYTIVARYYSRSRQNVVYDLKPLDRERTRIDPKIGQGLLKLVPKPEPPEERWNPDPEWED